MADCSNVEIRELLPERAGGALSAADIARVDAHLGGCELCTVELSLIRTARRVLRVSPAIDVTRIASGVIAATAAPSRPQLVTSGSRAGIAARGSRLRWVGWKAAAAIAIAAAGAGSFAVWSTTSDRDVRPNGASTASVAVAPGTSASAADPAGIRSASVEPVVVASARGGSTRAPEIGVGGGLSELSEADLQALIGDLGTAGGLTAADASFEEPDSVEPSVGTVQDGEST